MTPKQYQKYRKIVVEKYLMDVRLARLVKRNQLRAIKVIEEMIGPSTQSPLVYSQIYS